MELEVRIGEIVVVAELVVFMYDVMLRLVEFILLVKLLYEVVDGMIGLTVVEFIVGNEY